MFNKSDPFIRTVFVSSLMAIFFSLALLRALSSAADFSGYEGASASSIKKAAAPSNPTIGKYTPTVTALTYNIQGASTIFKVGKLGALVKTLNADFVFLSEAVDGNLVYPNQPASIARTAGYKYVAFKGNERIWTQIEMLGNAILSRTELYDVRKVALPKIEKKSEPRGIVAAKTKFAGREVGLIAVHLSRIGYKNERRKQIEFLASFIKSNYAGIPVIMGGDFNTSHSDDIWGPINALMDEGYLYLAAGAGRDAKAGFTMPSNAPNVKFDYIFTRKGRMEPVNATVYPSTLSDHRPFYVQAKFK